MRRERYLIKLIEARLEVLAKREVVLKRITEENPIEEFCKLRRKLAVTRDTKQTLFIVNKLQLAQGKMKTYRARSDKAWAELQEIHAEQSELSMAVSIERIKWGRL